MINQLALIIIMKVHSCGFLAHLQLDSGYCLLNGRDVNLLLEFFKTLDVRGEMSLDDVQFLSFMQVMTNLGRRKVYQVFDILDVDRSGMIDFDEFYLLTCILLAVRDEQEKQFISCHSRTVFELLDQDGSASISVDEFENFGFLFNFDMGAVRQIFREFDVSGDQLNTSEELQWNLSTVDKLGAQILSIVERLSTLGNNELDYQEFKLFALACIDRQTEIELSKQPATTTATAAASDNQTTGTWCVIQ